MKKEEKLILIDGNALLYRAFYALPPLTNSKGTPTGAVYGFTRMLMKLLQERQPQYIACAFDKGKKTFRHRKFKDYKANRPSMPEELVMQIPLVKEVLEAFRIPIFEDEEYEADDLLGTLAKKGEEKGLRVEILTGDKDIFQIISPSIYILRPKKGITETHLFNEEEVKKEFGISSSQIVDFLSLAGDSSDNIPGVPSIGPVTAKGLIQKFKTLENLLDNLEELPSKKRDLLRKYIPQAKLSKKLATIITTVPLKINLKEFKVSRPEKDLLFALFKRLEFKKLIKEFAPSISQSSQTPDYYEIAAPEKLKNLASKLRKTSFTLDMEKDKKTEGIAFSLKDEAPYWLPLEGTRIKKDLILKELTPIFEDAQIKKIGHNLKRVILQLKRLGINLTGLGFDTQLAAYLLNPLASNYSLGDLCLNYLGTNIPEELHPTKKVKLIEELSTSLEERLKKESLWNLFNEVEMPLVGILAKMQEKGIKIDKAILKEFLKEIKEKREKIEEEVYEEVGQRFNINSPKQLGKILFEKLNLPPLKKTKTGYSTNEEVLQALSLLRPSISKILEYRRLFKLETTYLKPFPELINPETGRIHTSFNQTVTATGRLSSSGPNLQNIPIRNKLGERLRKAFVVEKEYLFLSGDYSQIELRFLAHVSGDNNLKSAFLENEDIHRQTAAEIFDVLPLEVTAPMRRKAKVVNFGIVYGMSPRGLSKDLGISYKEAQDYIQRYFKRYPEVKKYINKTLEEAQKRGYVTTLMGRKRALPGISSPHRRTREFAERTAINSPIQGGAADLIKLAMINLERRFKKEKLGVYIILQIHDELLFEVPEAEIGITRKIVKQEMEKAMKLSVPLLVETKVGKNWGEME